METRSGSRGLVWCGAAVATACWSVACARADVPPSYDFDFVTIRDVGNAPFVSTRPEDIRTNGRGRVDYEYRVARTEITSAQWMEFLNAFAPFANSPIDQTGPIEKGFVRSQRLANGNFIFAIDPTVPNAAQFPIGGVSWRDAARYCNWLHNNKEVSLVALSSGAYDTSTWGFDRSGRYTDAPNRMPGARYFMPTVDEYLKAVHYDPNRFSPGQGGYWQTKATQDTGLIPGPPGVGQTNAGYRPGGDPFAAWRIPLGAYPETRTAYGLLDAGGGGSEYLEVYPGSTTGTVRPYGGPYAGSTLESLMQTEYVGFLTGGSPTSQLFFVSFRVYSPVPSPGAAVMLGLVVVICGRRSSNAT